MLVIEVKGGGMEARDGRWFQNGKPLDHSPRDQAHGYLDKLMGRLRTQGTPIPAHGIATWFADTPVPWSAPRSTPCTRSGGRRGHPDWHWGSASGADEADRLHLDETQVELLTSWQRNQRRCRKKTSFVNRLHGRCPALRVPREGHVLFGCLAATQDWRKEMGAQDQPVPLCTFLRRSR